MGGIGILTLLPVIARDWGMSIQWISLAATVYMVPFAIFQLFSGPIAHIFDARKTLLFGFGVYGLGAILSGLSPNLPMLLVALVIWGVGAAHAVKANTAAPTNTHKTMSLRMLIFSSLKFWLVAQSR